MLLRPGQRSQQCVWIGSFFGLELSSVGHLKVEGEKRVYHFACASETDLIDWMTVVQCIRSASQGQTRDRKESKHKKVKRSFGRRVTTKLSLGRG